MYSNYSTAFSITSDAPCCFIDVGLTGSHGLFFLQILYINQQTPHPCHYHPCSIQQGWCLYHPSQSLGSCINNSVQQQQHPKHLLQHPEPVLLLVQRCTMWRRHEMPAVKWRVQSVKVNVSSVNAIPGPELPRIPEAGG